MLLGPLFLYWNDLKGLSTCSNQNQPMPTETGLGGGFMGAEAPKAFGFASKLKCLVSPSTLKDEELKLETGGWISFYLFYLNS